MFKFNYIIVLLLLTLTILSCKNNYVDRIEGEKLQIDKYPITEHRLQIEVDSFENHLDTIYATKIKKNSVGDILYREYKVMDEFGKLKTHEYYRNNELIYMSNLSYNETNESRTYFEHNEKGLIVNGISFITDLETKKSDTIQTKVIYEFKKNGKKKKMLFYQEIDSTKLFNEVYFNENGDTKLEIEYSRSDTISKTYYKYVDTLLIQKVYQVEFGKGKMNITKFDKNEIPKKIEYYEGLDNDSILLEEKIYTNTKDGKHKKALIINHKKGEERIIKYEYIKISGT